MDDKRTTLTEEELKLLEETERFLEAIDEELEMENVELPANMYENIWKEIRAREAVHARENLCDEDKELLRLGRAYKKRNRMHKYMVLAAAVVAVLALGITSVGGPEKIFETLKRNILVREQVQVNSGESVEPVKNLDEEKTYEEIENKFGFLPVKLNHLPEDIVFIEGEVSEEVPRIFMLYGKDEEVNISYIIRPNYRESSWGNDIEDELLEEYDMIVEGVRVQLRKYYVEEQEVRWMVGFEYENVSYSMLLMHLEQKEVEAIVENLYFN